MGGKKPNVFVKWLGRKHRSSSGIMRLRARAVLDCQKETTRTHGVNIFKMKKCRNLLRGQEEALYPVLYLFSLKSLAISDSPPDHSVLPSPVLLSRLCNWREDNQIFFAFEHYQPRIPPIRKLNGLSHARHAHKTHGTYNWKS